MVSWLTLNEISGSLDVSVATAGQLISAGAVLMCVGAPLCAALVCAVLALAGIASVAHGLRTAAVR